MINKGIIANNLTTSLNSPDGFLKAENIVYENGCFKVRSGITYQTNLESQSVVYKPLDMQSVCVASQDMIMYINNKGDVFAIIEGHCNEIYTVKRKHYDSNKVVTLANANKPPTVAKIIEMGNYIYLISDVRSFVIYKDGHLTLSPVSSTDRYIRFDMLEATIEDLDGELPTLEKVSKKYLSQIEKNTNIFVRSVSELGGRGAPSDSVVVNEQSSYFVSGIGKIPRIMNTWVNGCCTRPPLAKMARVSSFYTVTANDVAYNGYPSGTTNHSSSFYSLKLNKKDLDKLVKMRSETDIESKGWKQMSIATEAGFSSCWIRVDETNNIYKVENTDDYSVKAQIICPTTTDHTVNSVDLTNISYLAYNYAVTLGAIVNDYLAGLSSLCVAYVDNKGDGILVYPDWDNMTNILKEGAIVSYKDAGTFDNWYTKTNMDATKRYLEMLHPEHTMKIVSDPMDFAQSHLNYQKHRYVLAKTSDETATKRYSEILPWGTSNWPNDYTNSASRTYINHYTDGELVISYSKYVKIKINRSTLFNLKKSHIAMWRSNNGTPESLNIPVEACYVFSPIMFGVYNGTTPANSYYIDSAWLFEQPKSRFLTSSSINYRYTPDNSGRFAKVDYSVYPTTNAHIDYNTEGRICLKNTYFDDLYYNAGNNFDIVSSVSNTGYDNNDSYRSYLYEAYIENVDADVLSAKQYNCLPLSYTVDNNTAYVEDYPVIGDPVIRHNVPPLAMAKLGVLSEYFPKTYNRAIGNFFDIKRWGNYFVAATNSEIKVINYLLEWEVEKTISLPTKIIGLEVLGESVYIFTKKGIYVMLQNMSLEYLADIVVKKACVAQTQLFMVDEKNNFFMTEFTPIPVQNQYKNETQNPYIIVKQQNELFTHVTDNIKINDLCYFEQCVYLACEDGVYTFDLNYKTLMRHTFPSQVGEVQRIVVNNSELFMMTNTVTKFELINKASALPTIPENEGSGGGGG